MITRDGSHWGGISPHNQNSFRHPNNCKIANRPKHSLLWKSSSLYSSIVFLPNVNATSLTLDLHGIIHRCLPLCTFHKMVPVVVGG